MLSSASQSDSEYFALGALAAAGASQKTDAPSPSATMANTATAGRPRRRDRRAMHPSVSPESGDVDCFGQRGSVGSVMPPGRVMLLGSVIWDVTHESSDVLYVAVALPYRLPDFMKTPTAPSLPFALLAPS